MHILRHILIVLLFCSTAAMAAPANESSVRELLTITQTQKLIESIQVQMDAQLNHAMRQALQGKKLLPGQQQALTNMHNKVVKLVHETLSWEKLEPMYLRLYQETFTEDEVLGMLSFYKTPAGQAVIIKMPSVVQKTMIEVQAVSSSLAPQLQKIQQDFLAELTAATK
ncbi:MAG: DUF2059 domain-containing protein [Gallionella sp.]|nr:DUF2059 domain-containing protein [Gallionella sp.]